MMFVLDLLDNGLDGRMLVLRSWSLCFREVFMHDALISFAIQRLVSHCKTAMHSPTSSTPSLARNRCALCDPI